MTLWLQRISLSVFGLLLSSRAMADEPNSYDSLIDKIADFKDGATETFANILSNMSAHYGSIGSLIESVSYFLALIFVVVALFKLRDNAQDPDRTPINYPIALLGVAAVLSSVGSSVGMGSETIFGSSYSFISYNDPRLDSSLAQNEFSAAGVKLFRGVTGFIQLLGFIAFIKGWVMVKNSQRPGGNPSENLLGRGGILIAAGILGVNIILALKIAAFTIGADGFLDDL